MRVILILIILFAASVGALWLLPSSDPQQVSEKTEAEIIPYQVEETRDDIRDVTPEETLPGPNVDSDIIVRLPGIVPPEPPAVPAKPVVMRNLIIREAGTLVAKDLVIKIKGINSLALDKICKTADGETWPCGRFARTALRGLIGSRAVECDPLDAQKNPVPATCRVGGRDIATWLVAQGWAQDIDGSYAEFMTKAKQAKNGMWRTTLP